MERQHTLIVAAVAGLAGLMLISGLCFWVLGVLSQPEESDQGSAIQEPISVIPQPEARSDRASPSYYPRSGFGTQAADGIQIEPVYVNRNAWPLLKIHNQFNDPPLEGRRMLLMKVRVTNVSPPGSEPFSLDQSDFRLVGDAGTIYTTYHDESSCGVIPDELDGTLLPGDWMSGNICFQVPRNEEAFQLLYFPFLEDTPLLSFDVSRIKRVPTSGR